MITLDCEQGSPEWHAARLGVATASEFDCIMTPGGKAASGKAVNTYINTLIAEKLTGKPYSFGTSIDIRRGIELEPEARANYAFLRDCEPEIVGMVYLDERRLISCSPDALVGESGLWECKCPKDHTHVGYLRDGKLPDIYRAQVQGQIWITGRDWCDFMSYHPDMKALIVRVERDEAYIKTLKNEVERLVYDMAKALEKLEA